MPKEFLRTDMEMLVQFSKDIERFKRDNNQRLPTTREYIEMGPKIPLSTLYDRFMTYTNAIERADKLLDGNNAEQYMATLQRKYTDQEIIDQYRELSESLGHPASTPEYRKLGLVCIQTVYRRFKSFKNFQLRSGLNPTAVDKEAVLEDLQKIIMKLDHIPTLEEYKKHTDFGYSYLNRYCNGLKMAATALALDGRIPRELFVKN